MCVDNYCSGPFFVVCAVLLLGLEGVTLIIVFDKVYM